MFKFLNQGAKTSDATATSDDIRKGKTAYVKGEKLTGTLNAAKLFNSEEEMNADANIRLNDKAVIIHKDYTNMTSTSSVQDIKFEKTITLPDVVTESYSIMLESESGIFLMIDCILSPTEFRFNCMGEFDCNISYTSEDGQHYTTDKEQEIHLPTSIMARDDRWNDNIGYFLKISTNFFEGIYNAEKEYDNSKGFFMKINDLTLSEDGSYITWNRTDDTVYSAWDFGQIINQMKKDNKLSVRDKYFVFMTKDNKFIIPVYQRHKNENDFWSDISIVFDNDFNVYGFNATPLRETTDLILYELDITNHSYKVLTTLINGVVCNNNFGVIYAYDNIASLAYPFSTTDTYARLGTIDFITYKYDNEINNCSGIYDFYDNNGKELEDKDVYSFIIKYHTFKTQFDATDEYVYEKTYYGENGIGKGTITENVSPWGNDINGKILQKILDIYDNMEPVRVTNDDITTLLGSDIKKLPTNKNGEALIDTSSVTTMGMMFRGCKNLTTIPLINTSSAINMNYMFSNCDNLITIPLIDTSHVTAMENMFGNDISLQEIPNLDTQSCTTMYMMFSACSALQKIPLLDTHLVTNMSSMFAGCNNLTDIPELNTTSCVDMSGMFNNCTNLQEIPLLNTSKVTNMSTMFCNVSYIKSIPELDTSSVNNMNNMFASCGLLEDIPLLSTSSVEYMKDIISGCQRLTDDSMNNILQMCINSKVTDENKTLKYIGVWRSQVEKYQQLENWSGFEAAGWTTGY